MVKPPFLLVATPVTVPRVSPQPTRCAPAGSCCPLSPARAVCAVHSKARACSFAAAKASCANGARPGSCGNCHV